MSLVREVYVQQGEVHASEEACAYKTVLGSCIAVCLWDPVRRIGGLNHFVLPRGGPDGNDARYGDVAIPRLIKMLEGLGCDVLVAKIFGGCAMLPLGASPAIGDNNTAFALTSLQERRIPVLAQRTGGVQGMSIRFFSSSGSVQIKV